MAPRNSGGSYNGGKWTKSKFQSFIKSILRGGSNRWPPKYEALQEAYTGSKRNPKSGRIAKFYKCNSCGSEFVGAEVQVDHRLPVGGPEGTDGWDGVIRRLFCEKEGLQVLCKPCHDIKTKKERQDVRRPK